ncbi:hypothetical protein BDZ89DRAFT_1060302 [Hymenopellis radicata]|nr:hypothetical protein BDZ89DRAFT_1060302 [Hymenopellis radicata]
MKESLRERLKKPPFGPSLAYEVSIATSWDSLGLLAIITLPISQLTAATFDEYTACRW